MTRLQNHGGFKSYSAFYNSPSPPIYPTERKLKKPLMEKHRRERMNRSMNELKERIIQAHPHESSKLEKADILEKAVLYVNELESHTKTVHHEKIRAFQQGYLQACHELVELISQQSNCLQSSNSTDLKQKLRQTIDKHLTGRCTVDQQQAVPTPILMNANPGFQMQLGPNRLNAMGRVIPPPTNLPFMMPPPFNLNCLARLPMQSSTSSSSLFPFQATPFIRPVPLQSGHSVTQPSQQLNTATVPEEEIDVERVEEERNGGINTTTEDSGVESPTTKSAEVWRPFEVF